MNVQPIFSQHKTVKTSDKASIWQKKIDVTLTEIKAHIGMELNMALTEKCDVKDYVSTE